MVKIAILKEKKMERENIKTLIECATSFEKADSILKKYTNYESYKERIAYLQGMFDCQIISRNTDDIYADYVAILTSIVNYG